MNSTKSFSNRNTIVSYFTGIGLFVTTVAIYQYIQIYHAEEEESGSKKFNNNNNDDDDVDAADKKEEQRKDALRKAFERRQLSRRLSFDQFEDTDTEEVLLIQEAEKHRFWNGQMDCDSTFRQRQRGSSRSNNNNNNNAHSSNEHPYPPPRRHHHHRRHREQQQQQRRRRHQPLETADNDRYHDFHPNYQNWCHFEKNNEDDNKAAKKKRREQTQQQQPQRQPKIKQHNRYQQQSQDAGEKQQESPAVAEIDHQVYSLSEAAAAANDVVNEKTTNCEESRQKSVTTRKVSLYDLEKSKQMRRRQQQQQVDYISDDNNSIVTFASSYDDDHCNDHCNNHDNDVDRINSTRTNIITSNNISLQICSNYQPNTTNKSSNHRQLIHRDITTSGNSRRRRGSNNSSISSKSCRNSNKSSKYRRTTDGTERIGRFQRFCRMLSGDDDIGSSGSKEEDNISISGENHNTTIFSSLNSSSGISFSNNDADTEDDDDDDDDDAETLHRALRAEYNARIIPEKLVLIRHGQSAGNVNEALYATTPDNAMPITELGWNQAKKAGIILKEKIINSGETVHFIVSPYVRTVETFHGIVSAWCDPDGDEFASIADHNCKVNAWYERLTELGLTWNEDSRIREQDFGNYQTPELTKRAKEERHKFGAFYYRFNNGESGSDVFDRVSTFLDSLWRSFETNKSQNYVLVTHGIVLRVLMARYFRYTISQLNMLANPTNCEMVILGHNWRGRLVLEGRCELEMTTTNTNTDTEESNDNDENISERNQSDKQKKPTASYRVTGYAFHKRLRILPKSLIRKINYRISSHDETKF